MPVNLAGTPPEAPPSPDQTLTKPDDAQTLQYVYATLRRLRYFRRQYDSRKAYFYRQYIGNRDRRLFPDNVTPRSNTFVPFPHKNVESVVSKTLNAFFGIDPSFEARKRGIPGEGNAEAMQWVMLTGLKRAKWQSQIEQLIRNICIYGHAGIAVDWDFDYDTVDGPEPIYLHLPVVNPQTGEPVLDPKTGQPQLQPLPYLQPNGQPMQIGTRRVTKKVPRNCPRISCIDAYDLMVDPDGTQVCRLLEKTVAQMKRESEANPKLYDAAALALLLKKVAEAHPTDPDGVLIRMAELWDEKDNSVTLVVWGDDSEATTWKDLRYSYRAANYSTYKRAMYVGGPIVLHRGPNPFAHKKPNILHTSYTKIPNEVYGIGIIEKSADLCDGVNNFCNMITDNWNLGINRRYAYDVQMDIDHDALNAANTPGGKVGVTGDPQKAIFPLPFMTPAAQDYEIIQLYKGMIDMVTGVSDSQNGGGPGAAGQPGITTAQIVTESNDLFQMFIRNLEEDILQPLLQMVSSMYQQFGTDELEFEITGGPPEIPKYGSVPLENLLGGYDFDFVGANYATNKIVRQRQLMAYYSLASQSPYVNQGEFLREIGKAMGIANASRLLKPDAQVQQEAQAMQQMQAQMQVLKELLAAERGFVTAQLRNAKVAGGGQDPSVTAHAMAAQEEIERLIQEEVFKRLGLELPNGQPVPAPQPQQQAPGRPPHAQHEGKIPGGDLEGLVRSMAQAGGANGLGLEGMNHANTGQ